jgi:hypothetical protein
LAHLAAELDQLIAFRTGRRRDLLLAAAFATIGLRNPVTNRLRSRLELARKIIRVTAGT